LPKNEPQILVNMQAKRATVGNSRFVRTHYVKVGFTPFHISSWAKINTAIVLCRL
jgi:hypothetical protein